MIQSAFTQEFDFDSFSTIYTDLNNDLPKDIADLSQFPKNDGVQQCLQEIFKAYISCYIELIAQVSTEDEGKRSQITSTGIFTDSVRH